MEGADLLPLLKTKLEATNAEIVALQADITRTRERLDAKLKHAPQRPSLDEAGLSDRIEDLEFKRSTTSMSISAEKEIIREINTLKAQKSSLGGYAAFQAEVERLRTSRTENTEKLRAAQATARELRDYVRKLEILERVRQANPGQTISTGDLRIAEIKVGAAHIPRLIGRKGATLREIEAAAGVTIDVDADDSNQAKEAAAAAAAGVGAAAGAGGKKKDSHKGETAKEAPAVIGEVSVKIMGLESGIMTAVGIIEAIAAQVEEDVHVSAGLLSYLISRSAAALKALEVEFGVKLHAEKDQKTISARGSPAAVESVRRRLAELESGKATVTIPGRALPSVLGKGGANFKKLREEGGAEIEIVRKELTPAQLAAVAVAAAAAGKEAKQVEREKEREEPVELLVYGPSDAVARTLHELRALIEEVREVEECVQVPRDAVPWLVGSGGERIAAFQKDTGVYARVVRAEDIPALLPTNPAVADAVRRHGVVKPGSKGPAVLPPHVALITFRGTKEAMAKGKPAFQALMADYARCNVILTVSLAQARAITGPQGATIKQMRADTGASIEVIEPEREERRDAEMQAKREKEKASASAAAATTAGADAKKGGKAAPAPAAAAAAEAAPRVRHNRAEELNVPAGHAAVTIRGDAAKVAAATDAVGAAIREYTENRVPVTSSVLSALFSNKGETISNLQKETGAILDVIRESAAAAAASAAAAGGKALTGALTLQQLGQIPPGGGLIVISGTASTVAAAEAKLRELVAANQERIIALPDPGLAGDIIGKAGANIKALQAELKVSIDVDKATLSLRLTGSPEALDAAAVHFQGFFDKYAREHSTMFIDPHLLPQVIGKGGATIKVIQEESGAKVDTDNSGELRISGPEDAVVKCKAKIAELLKLDQAVDTLSLDTAALSRLIGKGGANLRKLQEAHSVAIAVDPSTGVFTLRGEAEGIAAAKLALKRQSREALRVEEDVVVPIERVGTVVGARGAKVRSIEADTGCSLDIPRDRTGKSLTVRLRGTPLAVSKAKAIVSAIAAGKNVRALVRPTEHVAELRQGDAARSLAAVQAETGTRVMLFDAEPPVDDGSSTDDLPQGLIVVEASQWTVDNPALGSRARAHPSLARASSDDAAGVSRAVLAVDKLIGLRFGAGYAVVSLPQSLVSALGSAPKAASKGEEGKAAPAVAEENSETFAALIRSSGLTGASLDREGSYAALWGSAASVASAKASLTALADTFASRHAEVTIEGWMSRLVVGQKGKLESDTGCKVSVERDAVATDGPQNIDTSKATLRIAAPSAEALASAKEKAAALIADLAKKRVILCIPSAAFGALIGKGGATIKGLQEATGATVDFDRDRELVAIRGPAEENVTHAREEITALVEEYGHSVRDATDADLAAPLPRVLSGYDKGVLLALVGKGGAGVRKLQEASGCRISVDVDRGTVSIAASSDRAIYDGVAEVEAAIESAQNQKAAAAASAALAAAAEEAAATKAAYAAAVVAPVLPNAATRGLPVGAAPLTAEERLALASKKGGRNARRREKKRLEKEGLLGPGAPEYSDDEDNGGADETAVFLHKVVKPANDAPAAPAPVAVAPGGGAGGGAGARPVALPIAAAAAPKAAAAPASTGVKALPITVSALPIQTVQLPTKAATAAVTAGSSANDILAKLLPGGMAGLSLSFQPMTLPTAGGAKPAAAAAPAPAAAAPVAAAAVKPVAAPVAMAPAFTKPVFTAPAAVAAPAPAPAPAAPVVIGGVTMQIPSVTTTPLNIGGITVGGASSASAALAAAGVGGLNLPSFNLQAFNPKAAAPAAVAAAPAAAAAAKRAPPPGLASAPAPAPAAAKPQQAAQQAKPAGFVTQSAGFDLSSLGAALGLGSTHAATAAAPAPAPAAAPRAITTLPIGGFGGGAASASAAAALAGLGAPGAAPVTSLAALLSSPGPKTAGARTGAASSAGGSAAAASQGNMWKGAGGVNVRL